MTFAIKNIPAKRRKLCATTKPRKQRKGNKIVFRNKEDFTKGYLINETPLQKSGLAILFGKEVKLLHLLNIIYL